jgi:hypothetical protein
MRRTYLRTVRQALKAMALIQKAMVVDGMANGASLRRLGRIAAWRAGAAVSSRWIRPDKTRETCVKSRAANLPMPYEFEARHLQLGKL